MNEYMCSEAQQQQQQVDWLTEFQETDRDDDPCPPTTTPPNRQSCRPKKKQYNIISAQLRIGNKARQVPQVASVSAARGTTQ